MSERQQVLHLWLAAAALDTNVTAWAFYDGANGGGPVLPTEQPPYRTGVHALRDGWMLLQAPGPMPLGFSNAETGAEFVFTRIVSPGADPESSGYDKGIS